MSYITEAAKTGAVNLAYWDSKVPNEVIKARPEQKIKRGGRELTIPAVGEQIIERVHEPARRFAARLGTEYDPLTISGQRKHLNDKSHLTPYPNPENYTEQNKPSVGSWVQSGVEMDSLLFQYIMQLEDRIKALEAA